MKCPFCGGDQPDFDLRVDLDANVVAANGHLVRLTPQQAAVLHILTIDAPRWVSMEEIIRKNYGAGPVTHADPVMRMTISVLRKLLRPIGWNILGQYKSGYCLVRKI